MSHAYIRALVLFVVPFGTESTLRRSQACMLTCQVTCRKVIALLHLVPLTLFPLTFTRALTHSLSFMSFIRGIDFRRSQGHSQSQQRTPSHRRSPTGGGGADSPERHSRESSPGINAGSSGRRSSQRLEEYAVACARRNRLSMDFEEGLVEFAQVWTHSIFWIPYSHNTG